MRPLFRRVPRVWLVTGTALALAAGGAGLAVSSEPLAPAVRAITSDEADRMALARLTTYMASPVAVTVRVDDGGMVEQVSGMVDYRTGHAVGSYTVQGDRAALGRGLIAWDGGGLGIAPMPRDGSAPLVAAARIPPSGWSPRAYTTDPLDAALKLVMGLGADRPDNAQLLAQSGPRWLGAQEIDGRQYDIFSGPHPAPQHSGAAADPGGLSPLTYWIDATGDLRRVRMRMQGIPEPTVVDFLGRSADRQVPGTPWKR
jgi:hypothetical protein